MTDLLEKLASIAPRGAELLLAIRNSGLNREQLAEKLDTTHQDASLMLAVASVFEESELHDAQQHPISFAKFRLIAKAQKQLRNPNIDRAVLRQELLAVAPEKTVYDFHLHIKEILESYNEDHQKPRKSLLRFSANADADGMRYGLFKLPSTMCTRMQVALDQQAKQLVSEGQAVAHSEGLALALAACVEKYSQFAPEHIGETDHPDNPRDMRQRPCLLVPIAEAESQIDGTVVNSDGELINIADILNERIADMGFAIAIYRDHTGVARPQEIFDIKRLANEDDRFRAILGHLQCQHPECSIPAVRCDIHHVVAYSRGGPTTTANLCPLCHRHNLLNDDNPDHPKNGRIEIDPASGIPLFRGPTGNVRHKAHKVMRKSVQTYAHRMLGH
ncbi:HNH endonuclease [Corynebacterium sp. HS2168-gen11]|uniref:HNH endonuclease n=1 Tax=Corynebacterium sp. HS2168-gen11 TaxID=2974027 RepID=UPI00216AD90D|nr:HNH endonuclease signature motif containing protein [Corynebacterium sp. HS2168-gen11]MCS4535435.1 HNH endonuclease [Corynebacterium sp. HS2168-gen11]